MLSTNLLIILSIVLSSEGIVHFHEPKNGWSYHVNCKGQYRLPVRKKKLHNNTSLAPFTERVCCGNVSATLCNVTTFISIQSFIHFGWDFVLMTGESNQSFSLFQHIPKTFNGIKVRTLWWPIHVSKWLLMLPDTLVSLCSTLSSFTTRAWLILPL